MYILWGKIWTFIRSFFQSLSWKDLVYLFIIALLLILFSRGCHKKDPNVELISPALKPVTEKVDKKGTSYTEIKGVIYTQAQMNHITDSFRKVLKQGKVAQVLQTVSAPIHDTVPVKIYIDTFQHLLSAKDSNKNYKQTFEGNLLKGTGQFTLSIVPDSSSIVTTVKNNLFKRDELKANVYHTNDLFKPVMGTVYTSKLPRTLVDFDIFLGYDFFRKQVVVAPGIGLHLFSIKTRR